MTSRQHARAVSGARRLRSETDWSCQHSRVMYRREAKRRLRRAERRHSRELCALPDFEDRWAKEISEDIERGWASYLEEIGEAA